MGRRNVPCVVCGCCVVLGLSVGLNSYQRLEAQNGVRNNRCADWQPGAAAAAGQIHAQVDLQRALGESAVDFAKARKINAEAVSQEIKNSVEAVQSYWDRKAIHKAEMLKRYVSPFESQQLKLAKQWEWLEKDPNFAPEAIRNGRALNLLLDRLSVTVLTYSYAVYNPELDRTLVQKLKLDPDEIHSLMLTEYGTGGQRNKFRADVGEGLQVDWWPHLLRGDEFQGNRAKFEESRKIVLTEGKNVGNATVQKLLDAHTGLQSAFNTQKATWKSERRLATREVLPHLAPTQRFLDSLFGEILRIQMTGKVPGGDGKLKFEGKNLVELLTFMSRSALRFAEAQPGEEAAYHRVFQLMRDLYIIAEDPVVKDQETIKQIDQKRLFR